MGKPFTQSSVLFSVFICTKINWSTLLLVWSVTSCKKQEVSFGYGLGLSSKSAMKLVGPEFRSNLGEQWEAFATTTLSWKWMPCSNPNLSYLFLLTVFSGTLNNNSMGVREDINASSPSLMLAPPAAIYSLTGINGHLPSSHVNLP